MRKIVFATGNKNKTVEIKAILGEDKFEVVTMKEAGIDVEIVEDGNTFAENALIKARTVAKFTDAIVMADDSGLEIDCLNKEPGIYSALYMGEDTSYELKNLNLIERVNAAGTDRKARFVCAMAAVLPDKTEISVEGCFEGEIALSPAGENGFGYDPIFWVPERGCTSAQLPPEEKNAMSHRGKALRMMAEMLEKRLDSDER